MSHGKTTNQKFNAFMPNRAKVEHDSYLAKAYAPVVKEGKSNREKGGD